jgi:hypothetical protein
MFRQIVSRQILLSRPFLNKKTCVQVWDLNLRPIYAIDIAQSLHHTTTTQDKKFITPHSDRIHIVSGAMCELPPSLWRQLTHQRSIFINLEEPGQGGQPT